MKASILAQSEERKFLIEIRRRYCGVIGKKARGALISEACAVLGYERKYAIKVLGGKRNGALGRRKGGPKRRYDSQMDAEVLKQIWQGARRPGTRRLKELLPAFLPDYEKNNGALDEMLRARLLKMSSSTMYRLLTPFRAQTVA